MIMAQILTPKNSIGMVKTIMAMPSSTHPKSDIQQENNMVLTSFPDFDLSFSNSVKPFKDRFQQKG